MLRRYQAAHIAALVTLSAIIFLCGVAECSQEIVLANSVVARIVANGGFSSVAERAAKIDQRITQAISVEDVGNPNVWVSTGGGVPAIFIGKTLLMKVYPADASRSGISPAKLAGIWRSNLKRQFPLAEPVIHMSGEATSGELARAMSKTAAAAKVEVPAADWAIVGVVVDHFARARAMDNTAFADQMPRVVDMIYGDIRSNILAGLKDARLPVPPHAPGKCPEAQGCTGCRQAKLAALGGGERIEMTSDMAAAPPMAKALQRRIAGGLKLMRRVDAARFDRDKVMVAYTVVLATRKAVGNPGVDGKLARADE